LKQIQRDSFINANKYRKEFFMKNTLNVLLVRVFGIIAIVAVIGFSMAACGDLNVPVSGVALNKSSISLAIGGTETLTATVSPSDATNKDVGWSSSNTNVATVTYGTVTAVSAGSSTITVTTADGGKTAQCTVTVTGTTTPTNYSLEGVWQRANGTQVTVSGSTGVLKVITSSPDALTQSAIDKGYLSVGSQYWRNLTSTGNLTWSGQVISTQYYTSSPDVAIGSTWNNCTFTMSADGQTLTRDGSDTWTRM
jgi:hypothetical protein